MDNTPRYIPNDDLPLTRLDELLADRAVGSLTQAEAAELRQLLNRAGKSEDNSLEIAAAAFDRALEPARGVVIPDDLIERIEREGSAWCAGVASARENVLARLGSSGSRLLDSRAVRTPMVMGHRYLREWSGWIATAACLGFGAFMFAGRFNAPAPTGNDVAERVAAPQQRAVLIPEPIAGPVQRLAEDMTARAFERLGRIFSGPSGDVVIVPIGKAAPDAGDEVTIGEVVWSRREGAGVVRLSNIKPAESAGKNLQLWVFDSARGQKHPINAGVVPIRPGQTDVLVTLDPSMPIADAAAFVVTLEPPGGSVVAERDNMLAVGFVAAGEGMAPPPIFVDLPVRR